MNNLHDEMFKIKKKYTRQKIGLSVKPSLIQKVPIVSPPDKKFLVPSDYIWLSNYKNIPHKTYFMK